MKDHQKSYEESWRVFKIMAEFIEGFEKLSTIGPSISIFGSTRTKPQSKIYKLAVEVSKKISEMGFVITTGGGKGIMEAANKGAQIAKGISCGLCINLPQEEEPNDYIDEKYKIFFSYFFIRKVMLIKYAKAFVVFPGGFGTIDELSEALTLIQTEKIKSLPVCLIGKKYWSGLFSWLKNTVYKNNNITKNDLNLIEICDDVDETLDFISKRCSKHYSKNF